MLKEEFDKSVSVILMTLSKREYLDTLTAIDGRTRRFVPPRLLSGKLFVDEFSELANGGVEIEG